MLVTACAIRCVVQMEQASAPVPVARIVEQDVADADADTDADADVATNATAAFDGDGW